MRYVLFALTLMLGFSATLARADPFHVYLPSRSTNQLWVVEATPAPTDLKLSVTDKIDLGFAAATIVAHPEHPILYVSTNTTGEKGTAPGAVVHLKDDGSYKRHDPLALDHGYSYLSLSRNNRFLLGVSYREGNVDVYPLDEHGDPGKRVAFVDEGRTAAHAVLPSPDNKFVYIPYVKDSNALLQYAFDPATGALTPLDPPNANPPAGTGPRHIAYHPTKPFVYFSNEQGIGASVYEKKPGGQLELRQIVEVIPAKDRPEKGASASDCAITPDGRFLFTGQRSADETVLPNGINRYRILDNVAGTLRVPSANQQEGMLEHLGLTPAGAIPWGLAFSPDAKYLLATAFQGETLHAFRITKKGDLKKAANLPIDPRISDLVTR